MPSPTGSRGCCAHALALGIGIGWDSTALPSPILPSPMGNHGRRNRCGKPPMAKCYALPSPMGNRRHCDPMVTAVKHRVNQPLAIPHPEPQSFNGGKARPAQPLAIPYDEPKPLQHGPRNSRAGDGSRPCHPLRGTEGGVTQAVPASPPPPPVPTQSPTGNSKVLQRLTGLQPVDPAEFLPSPTRNRGQYNTAASMQERHYLPSPTGNRHRCNRTD